MWCAHTGNVRMMRRDVRTRKNVRVGVVPVSGVDEAEGRVREQIGEEKIAGNGRDGTRKRDMTQR